MQHQGVGLRGGSAIAAAAAQVSTGGTGARTLGERCRYSAKATPASGARSREPHRGSDGSSAKPHQGRSGGSTGERRWDRGAHVGTTVQRLSEVSNTRAWVGLIGVPTGPRWRQHRTGEHRRNRGTLGRAVQRSTTAASS